MPANSSTRQLDAQDYMFLEDSSNSMPSNQVRGQGYDEYVNE